jgi:chromosome segregation ATPase
VTLLMSKLVDKERLAKLAQALDARMKAAVKAEEDRAKAAELAIEGKADANAQAIAAINNAETGILKQAKDHADAIDADLQKQIDNKVEVEAYNAKVKELEDADDAFAEDMAGLDAAVKGLQDQMGEGNFGALDSAVKEATQELRAKDTELEAAVNKAQGEVDAVELRAEALEQKVGQDAAEGQPATGLFAEVDKVADDLALEIQRAQGAEVANTKAIEALDGRMDQAESDIDALQAKFEELTDIVNDMKSKPTAKTTKSSKGDAE